MNQIFNSQSVGKRIRHLIKGRIPKMDAVRELLSQLEPKDLTQVNDSVVRKIRKNKTFQKGTIDGYTVVAIDGVELFSSHKKSCEACLIRKHRKGTIDYFHRSVVCMSVGSDPHIILGEDFLHPRDGAAKDEGENTGAKRLIERLYKEHHHFADIIVGDALYLNAPFINTVLSCGMDIVIRGKDENRAILKDAVGLFKQMACTGEFTKDKIKVQAWDLADFELEGTKQKMRVLKFIEKPPKEKGLRTVWVVTSNEIASDKILWTIMHKRWDIEENGFHQLKTYYHADHCFVHKAVEVVFLINILAFNLREMYLFRRVKDFRGLKITRIEVTKQFQDDALLYDYKELILDG